MNVRRKTGSFLTGRLPDAAASDALALGGRSLSGRADSVREHLRRFGSVLDCSSCGPLTAVSRRAMGTDFEVSLNDSCSDGFSQVSATEIALAMLDEIDRVESILSVFLSDSLAGRVNALASEMDVPVTDEFLGWLEYALEIGRRTNRAFDATAGPLWQAWGFARRRGGFPTESDRLAALAASGPKHLTVDALRPAVRFDCAACRLNFGAIGKGIGLDGAAAVAEKAGLTDFLIQGGKSGAVARGGRAGDFSESVGRNVWTVNVADPLRPKLPLAVIRLCDRALATSGSAEQFFIQNGKRYSHIIDPVTGFPASGILSTTVLADTAAEADALSTAFFVAGEDFAAEYCRLNRRVSALLVVEENSAVGRRLTAINMTPDILAVAAPEIPFDVQS